MRNFIGAGSELEVLMKLVGNPSDQIKPRLKEFWEEEEPQTMTKTVKLKQLLASASKAEMSRHQPSYATRRARSLAALKDCNR